MDGYLFSKFTEMPRLVTDGAPSCLLSVWNVKYWPGKKNTCFCQKRHHFKKVTFETCSVSQLGTCGLWGWFSRTKKVRPSRPCQTLLRKGAFNGGSGGRLRDGFNARHVPVSRVSLMHVMWRTHVMWRMHTVLFCLCTVQ